MKLWQRLVLVLLTVALGAALVVFSLRLVLPAPPPSSVAATAAPHEPLTHHLAIVVVDGLRYDIATDPAIMPRFAQAMAEHTSAEFRAGPVTMTTSAIQAWTTGQSGGLAHIVYNETERPTALDNLVAKAKAAGLSTAATGDVGWFDFFPHGWDAQHPDPPGVSIDVDYDQEIFDAAYSFLRLDPQPGLLVAHFVTPDHQGHVHTILSEGYRRHMRWFDKPLSDLVQAMGPDWTVFVLSDHGMTDMGKHGSDSPIQRRAPGYALGRGIRPGVHPSEPVPQTDLAATFTELLGLPSPADSVGHVLADWLDLPAAGQAEVGCAELQRIARFAQATLGSSEQVQAIAQRGCEGATAADKLAHSREASRQIAGIVHTAAPLESGLEWGVLGLAVLGAMLLGALWSGARPSALGRQWALAALGALVLLVVGVWLTKSTENLPGNWPNRVRIGLSIVANAALLGATVWLRRSARWLDRHAPLAATLIVGSLVVTYTRYTQVQSYIFVCVASLVLLVPALRRRLGLDPAAVGNWPSIRSLVALGLVALGWSLGIQEGHPLPDALAQSPVLLRYMAAGAMVVFAIERHLRPSAQPRSWSESAWVAGSTAVAISALWIRSAGMSKLAIALWVLLPLAALALWRARRNGAAVLLSLGAYALVSRDDELLVLLPSIYVAEALAEVIGPILRRSAQPSGALARDGAARAEVVGARHAVVVGLVGLIFAMSYVQRVGIQLGLDFTHFDWAAGTFGDGNVSMLRIGTAIVFKHGFARAAILVAMLAALPVGYRAAVVRAVLLVELGRTVVLMATLYECRTSFWTAFRVLGDAPHAFIAVAVATVACAYVLRPPRAAMTA